MARYCGAVCRLCRREGEKLYLKGERCFSSKCAVDWREGGPGQHGKGRQQFSDFKIQLREKQKVKRIYGLLETKFHRTFEKAARTKGVTGTELLVNLETMLANVIYRLGFAGSRKQARQIVLHGHVLVNGKKISVPAYQVSAGDVVEIAEASKQNIYVQAAMEAAHSRMIPEWLSLDKAATRGSVNAVPTRDQLPSGIKEQLIVELYSK